MDVFVYKFTFQLMFVAIMLLRFVSSTSESTLQCVIPKNSLTLIPDKNTCSDYNCWESQLTDFTRLELVKAYNRFRNNVAARSFAERTYSDMNYAEWHWLLEEKAQQLLGKECPFAVPPTPTYVEHPKEDIGYLEWSDEYEYAATSFPLQTGLQREWIRDVEDLFENNHLGDWDTNSTHLFRRASVSYFGCAIVSRNHVFGTTGTGRTVLDTPAAHLLCVYAFEKKGEHEATSLASPKAPCIITFPARARNTSGTGDFLCRIKHYSDSFNDQLPCQVYYETLPQNYPQTFPCAMNEKTVSWQMRVERVIGVMPRTREEMILWSESEDDYGPLVVRRERDYLYDSDDSEREYDPANDIFSAIEKKSEKLTNEELYCLIILGVSLCSLIAMVILGVMVYTFMIENALFEK